MIRKGGLKEGEFYWIITKNSHGREFLGVALCGHNGDYMQVTGSDMEVYEFEAVSHVPIVSNRLTNLGKRSLEGL